MIPNRSPSPCSRVAPIIFAAIPLAWATPSRAMEPLADFIQSAKTRNLDMKDAVATLGAREADASAAKLKLLPTVTARGAYTFNQFEAIVRQPATATSAAREAIITP